MALDALRCNHLTSLGFKGLIQVSRRKKEVNDFEMKFFWFAAHLGKLTVNYETALIKLRPGEHKYNNFDYFKNKFGLVSRLFY